MQQIFCPFKWCFVPGKFELLMIFLKRWFGYQKTMIGEMHKYRGEDPVFSQKIFFYGTIYFPKFGIIEKIGGDTWLLTRKASQRPSEACPTPILRMHVTSS